MPTRDGPPADPRPLRRDAARNRERIITAARDLFAEEGLEASLADIADRANVGLGTIYRNFSDKQDLIASLVDEKLDIVSAIVDEVQGLASGWASFTSLIERLIESFVADRSLEEIMLSEDGHRFARQALERLAPGATRIIERATDEGTLRHGVEFSDLPMILVMIKSTAEVTAPVDPTIWRRYLHIVLNGLAAHPDNEPLTVPAMSEHQLQSLTSLTVTAKRRLDAPMTD